MNGRDATVCSVDDNDAVRVVDGHHLYQRVLDQSPISIAYRSSWADMSVMYRVLSQSIAKPQGYKAKLAPSQPSEPADTCSKSAQRFYGHVNTYPRILEANQEVM
jgi:hypothetical protein